MISIIHSKAALPHRDLARTQPHGTLKEGAMLGLVVATGTWLWLAMVDAAAGAPFFTVTLLGGFFVFTLVHYALNVLYGVVIMAGVHGAEHEPGLIFAVGFGFLMMEFGFGLLTAILSSVGLGELAWIRIFGGSLVGGAIAAVAVARKHHLVALLRKAEAER